MKWSPAEASPELRVALAAARAAGRLQMRFFRQNFNVETKADATPVTQIDRDSEALIRTMLVKADPGIGFLGEETANGAELTPLATGARWIVDPLDGTSKFVRGLPTFGPCIALEAQGELVIGVMHVPALNETIWAERGAGAFLNGERVHVSTRSEFTNASIAWGYDPAFLRLGWADGLEQLRSTHVNPGFLDLYTYLCLAAGRIDGVLMADEHPWDVAAALVIIEEAGGRLTDFRGERSVYSAPSQTAASNGYVHDSLLELVKDCW